MIDEGFIRFQVSNISRSKQILLVKIDILLSNVSIGKTRHGDTETLLAYSKRVKKMPLSLAMPCSFQFRMRIAGFGD